MTETEAEKCLAEYRALLKAWTMCVVGLNPGDSEVIGRKLDTGEPLLLRIAAEFPKHIRSTYWSTLASVPGLGSKRNAYHAPSELNGLRL